MILILIMVIVGKYSLVLIIRDSLIADISNSEAFESDNNAERHNSHSKNKCYFQLI